MTTENETSSTAGIRLDAKRQLRTVVAPRQAGAGAAPLQSGLTEGPGVQQSVTARVSGEGQIKVSVDLGEVRRGELHATLGKLLRG